MGLRRFGAAIFAALLAASGLVGSTMGASPKQTVVVYDNFESTSGYTLADYSAKWSNVYGLGDMGAVCPDTVTPGHGDTRSFSSGAFHIDDAPFTCGADFSVFDHLKYIAISNAAFPVPERGALTFSSVISAQTPGTEDGHVVHGTYGPPGSYHPGGAPYAATVLEGQQAGAVMNMINFSTGQLFDWFVSGSTAFALIERLPSAVTGNATGPSDPNWVGPEKMYTQIIVEVPIGPGPHAVSITYTRGIGAGNSTVEYFLDGRRVAKVKNVGVPLDKQPGQTYTGYAPSFGPGEDLKDQLDSFVIGHGTFSLLDAFPYQWGWSFGPSGPTCEPAYPTVCAASVSIPLAERLFGQGVIADFDDFEVSTLTH
jgi:hypothetical protein